MIASFDILIYKCFFLLAGFGKFTAGLTDGIVQLVVIRNFLGANDDWGTLYYFATQFILNKRNRGLIIIISTIEQGLFIKPLSEFTNNDWRKFVIFLGLTAK